MRELLKYFLISSGIIALLLYSVAVLLYEDAEVEISHDIVASKTTTVLRRSPNETSLQNYSISTDQPIKNVTNPPSASPSNIFYNVIGKCGSRTMLRAIASAAKANNFILRHPDNSFNPHPGVKETRTAMKRIANSKPPTMFYRHLHYLDFRKHGFEPPIYINIVRDPISRFTSHYNFRKYGDMGIVKKVSVETQFKPHINDCVMNDEEFCRHPMIKYYISSYFCGFDPVCTKSSSKERLELAKAHIIDNYLFIGLAEDFNNSVALLEKMMPKYFTGLTRFYAHTGKSITAQSKSIKKDVLSDEAAQKLCNEIFVDDYEIFNFARAKYERLKKEYGIP